MTSIPQAGRGRSNAVAVALAISCTGIFALIFASGRFAGELASPLQIMFLRYVGGFLTVALIALLQGEAWLSMQSQVRSRHVLRALSGALGGVAIIYGNAELPMQADPEARIEGLADHAVSPGLADRSSLGHLTAR